MIIIYGVWTDRYIQWDKHIHVLKDGHLKIGKTHFVVKLYKV